MSLVINEIAPFHLWNGRSLAHNIPLPFPLAPSFTIVCSLFEFIRLVFFFFSLRSSNEKLKIFYELKMYGLAISYFHITLLGGLLAVERQILSVLIVGWVGKHATWQINVICEYHFSHVQCACIFYEFAFFIICSRNEIVFFLLFNSRIVANSCIFAQKSNESWDFSCLEIYSPRPKFFFLLLAACLFTAFCLATIFPHIAERCSRKIPFVFI